MEQSILKYIRPYRYPYVQKEEIENQVNDMLHAGIIQRFHSPFASPVLLVKKRTVVGVCVSIIVI